MSEWNDIDLIKPQADFDVIVAVGGGSVIDSAKITALAIANNSDPWAIMKYKVKPESTIPLIPALF